MASGAGGSLQWLNNLLRDGKGGEEAAAAAVPLAITGLVLGGKYRTYACIHPPHPHPSNLSSFSWGSVESRTGHVPTHPPTESSNHPPTQSIDSHRRVRHVLRAPHFLPRRAPERAAAAARQVEQAGGDAGAGVVLRTRGGKLKGIGLGMGVV